MPDPQSDAAGVPSAHTGVQVHATASAPMPHTPAPVLSPPVLVGRRKGYYWFPTLLALADGSLLVSAYDDLDAYSSTPMGLYSWSSDGGRTWIETPVRAPFSECGVTLDSGDHLLLPYRLSPHPSGMVAAAAIVPLGRREIMVSEREVSVTGWPRPPQSQGDPTQGEVVTGGFSFNGQVVRLTDGTYLTTLYGRFTGESRYSLVAAASEDGLSWSVRSVIAGPDCPLPGGEGPCEAALAQLGDGRLACVFRMDGNFANVYDPSSPLSARPYGWTWSEDEGSTWSTPVQLGDTSTTGDILPGAGLPGSVQPSLVVLPTGTVALSGGRPGLYLWWNNGDLDGQWHFLDLQSHHNTCHPEEPILTPVNTSSYTEVLALNESQLLVVYDRLPWGWRPIPSEARDSDDPADSNSIWVVHIDFTDPPLGQTADGQVADRAGARPNSAGVTP